MSEGGLRIFQTANAGGNSIFSEVLSFEFMQCMYDAKLDKTEMEIVYQSDCSKKVDYSMCINGERIGVSVTRAFHFVDDYLFTHKQVIRLLEKKLEGLKVATNNVIRRDRWQKQILHIWVKSEHVANMINEVYDNLAINLRKDAIVLLTVAPTITCVFDETAGDQEKVFRELGISKPVYVHEYEDVAFGVEDFGSFDHPSMEIDIDALMNGYDCNSMVFDDEDTGNLPSEDLVDFYAL